MFWIVEASRGCLYELYVTISLVAQPVQFRVTVKPLHVSRRSGAFVLPPFYIQNYAQFT